MSGQKVFKASPEAKGKAKQLRLFAFLVWIIAIAGQIFAIFYLIGDDTLTWLIVVIVGIFGLVHHGIDAMEKSEPLRSCL